MLTPTLYRLLSSEVVRGPLDDPPETVQTRAVETVDEDGAMTLLTLEPFLR
jgi:hypothetical protein